MFVVLPYSDRPPLDLWNIGAPIEPLAGGHRNLAFRTNGRVEDLVFKTTRRNAEAIAWLGPVLAIAEESGFIVPHLIMSKTGRAIEHGWTCERFIHGQPFRPADMNRLAVPLRRFQIATFAVAQRPGFLAARDLLHQDRGGDIDLSRMPADIVALCREAWRRIEHAPVCAVHGDLNPSNLLLTAGDRIAVLDWDECRVDAGIFDTFLTGPTDAGGDIEMAAIAWEIACSWQLEPGYARRLAETFRHRA
jgi:hypothetical protein